MKKVVFFLALMAVGMMAVAQNPYLATVNNEDEVVKIDRHQSQAAAPLQAIVKLQDYSNYTISGKPGKSGATGRVLCPAIEAVLAAYTIEDVEQLCPTFVMPDRPRRAASYGGGEVTDHDLSQMYLITLSHESPKNEYELIADLSALDEVEYAEPNYMAYALGAEELEISNEKLEIADATYCYHSDRNSRDERNDGKGGAKYTPNDPLYGLQWGYEACNLHLLLDVPKRNPSWRPIIAIVDTGVDIDHSDLSGNIWTNSSEANGATNQDDDNNGFRDDVHGWDFTHQSSDVHDLNSHGTHCAGIAGAVTGNGIGVAGACPDALIMPVKVLYPSGIGFMSNIIQGVNYAAQNGADVISLSLGSYAYSSAFEQALEVAYQTAVIVAAAGNDSRHIDPRCCTNPIHAINDAPCFPGAYKYVIGVQATAQSGNMASFTNIDCDGPAFTQYNEDQLFNYELSAPGVGIMSTVPNGHYRSYNGTSMATPLVAGGIASLLQRRSYPSNAMLIADLINLTPEFSNVDFWATYNADPDNPAILQLITMEINDTLYGDSSMYADAGERVQLYPTIRTLWGPAYDMDLWLEFQPGEDNSSLQILQNHVALGRPISDYAMAKSINPIDIRIANGVEDGRKLKLTLCAASTYAPDTLRHDFDLSVTNGVKLFGMITHDTTLYPNVQYIVTNNLAVPSGVTLTIKPGVVLRFQDNTGFACSGTLIARGTPDSLITFTKAKNGNGNMNPFSANTNDTVEYVKFSNLSWRSYDGSVALSFTMRNCIIEDVSLQIGYGINKQVAYSNVNRLYSHGSWQFYTDGNHGGNFGPYTNFTNSDIYVHPHGRNFPYITSFHSCNIVNNIGNNVPFGGLYYSDAPSVCSLSNPSYFGSSVEETVRPYIFDMNQGNGYGFVDLSNMPTRPYSHAHGIVWKVEVNGYDAQDEFEQIIPLGVGTHEFKVYFNRAMDTSVTPMVTMGVCEPYTQTSICNNASWSTDSTIYTTHVTLTGRSAIDGLNRIFISSAQDNEHFEIPVENKRFNVYVASSGSMSAGFQATAGIGKVDLEWNDQEVNYDDFLGFNLYRYNYDSLLTNRHYVSGVGYVYDTVLGISDTVLLNQTLLQDTAYTDYDVVPGKCYYYFYKILSTSLTENSPSTTVSCVPNSTIPGDANGSFGVDVVDVIQVINYVTGQNPQPFLFDAADVNGDGEINVLDIVAIINIILHPGTKDNYNGEQYTAIYTIENDTLYINTPVELAGLQFAIGGCTTADIEVLPALGGFESVSAQNGDELMMLFYSMAGATVPAGKTALLRIGAGELTSVVAGDPQGHNLIMLYGDPLGLVDIDAVQAQFATAYPNPFSGLVHLDLTVGNYSNVSIVFTDMMGRQIDRRDVATPTAGRYSLGWDAQSLPRGVYFATLYADGQKAQTIKLIVK